MASLKLVRSPISRVSFDSWFQLSNDSMDSFWNYTLTNAKQKGSFDIFVSCITCRIPFPYLTLLVSNTSNQNKVFEINCK